MLTSTTGITPVITPGVFATQPMVPIITNPINTIPYSQTVSSNGCCQPTQTIPGTYNQTGCCGTSNQTITQGGYNVGAYSQSGNSDCCGPNITPVNNTGVDTTNFQQQQGVYNQSLGTNGMVGTTDDSCCGPPGLGAPVCCGGTPDNTVLTNLPGQNSFPFSQTQSTNGIVNQGATNYYSTYTS